MFSAQEMSRRRAAFAAELDGAGLAYGLVYGANRSGSAVSWLTGWPVTREALLVAGPDPADDVLLVSFFNHVPQARRLSAARAEPAGPDPVGTALELIAARGAPPAALPQRIGVAGALPFGLYRRLTGRVPEVVDLNPACTRLRLVKSAEEIAALRRGAALSDAATGAIAAALRPGVTDHEVIAAAEHAYVANGGLHHIHYLGVTAMDEPAVAVPEQWPTGRVIRHRDVVTCEISAAAAPDYAGQVLRTFTVGAQPTALYADLHAVAVAAFDAIAGKLRPGVHARDLAAVGAAIIGEADFTGIDDLVHGFGGGYLPPVVPAIGRDEPVPDFTLAAGMTLVVQPNVTTRDGRAGVQTGELLLVTDSGPERLHAFPLGLQQAGLHQAG
jgi:Xaa-Pro aminopeptidase